MDLQKEGIGIILPYPIVNKTPLFLIILNHNYAT